MRFLKLIGAMLMCIGSAQHLAAQDYPNRPVKIIVQFPPGGVPDTSGRLIAEKLTQALGKPFIVENRTGVGGNIATEMVAKSLPDGYTLLVAASASLTLNRALYVKLPFDVATDFVPITMINSFDFVMLAAPGFPPNSVGELVELAKANPGKFNVASSGFGSEHHLSGELFNLAADTRLTHVPYKGFGPATIDVMANQVELMFGSIPAALPLILGSKLKPLAVTGTARHPDLPDVPTFAEAGYPKVRVSSWVGLLAPSRTPQPIIDKLTVEAIKIVQSSPFAERNTKMGLGNVPVGSNAFAERIDTDTRFWIRVVKESKTKLVD